MEGFIHQWTGSGACGRYACRHAMLASGVPVSRRKVAMDSGRTYAQTALLGTPDGAMRRIFRRNGFNYRWHEYKCWRKMKRRLKAILARGHPAVISVLGYEHWATVIGRIGKRWVLADSTEFDNAVVSLSSKELKSHFDGKYYVYDVWPRQTGARLVRLPRRPDLLEKLVESPELQAGWGGIVDSGVPL